MKTQILLIVLLLFGCLKAKKSPFDFRSPNLLFGSLYWSSQQSGNLSVGGSISGFTAGTLVLQNNGANDQSLSPATSYSFGGMAKGSKYAITIKSNPTGFICAVANASGTISDNVSNANITCATFAVTAAYSTNGLKWNDYINRDFSKDIFSQADTPCNTANTGGYRTCVHAGEIRTFDMPSRTTCTGLTATDNLDAMNWLCRTNAKGGVAFYSSALKKGKYLSDLIDWSSNAWKSLTITVKDGTSTLAVSNGLKLWTNVIDASEPVSGFTSGRIYLYTNNVTGQLNLNTTNAVGIVFKPSTIYSITVGPHITSSGNFNWMEGSINAANFASNSVSMQGNFAVAKNLKIQNAGNCLSACLHPAIQISGNNNYLEDIVASNGGTTGGNSNHGIYISGSYNFLTNIMVSNNKGGDGISIASAANNNTILGVVTMNTSNGINISSNDLILANYTGANNATMVINFGAGVTSQKSLYKNVALVNGNISGLSGGSVVWNNNTIENIGLMTFNAAGNDIGSMTANNNYFTGVLKKSTSPNGCQWSGGTLQGLTNPGCGKQGSSDFNVTNGGNAYTVTSIVGTFIGTPTATPILTDNGLSTSPGGNPTNWLSFTNLFRGIGYYTASPYPSSSQQPPCTGGGTCSLYDFSLKSTDTVLRNANITGGGSGCPTAATMFTHTFTTGSVTILRNSVELLNDGVGNDNGLCEANEDCLLTPNIGAYQGHGNLVAASTVSGCADVPSQGIKLYQYETNGY